MKEPMEKALQVAQKNLKEIRTVTEWAERMGYERPKKFSRTFRTYYGERPLKILNTMKCIKAIELLTATDKTVYEIGWCELGIGDEKPFHQYLTYHTEYSPSEIRGMKNGKVNKLVEKLGSKIRE